MALAALPAEGIDSVFAPSRAARVTAADSPRALNELVGLSDSSLTYRPGQADRVAETPRVDERGPAFAERERRLSVEERHQLAIPPHVRLAPSERSPAATRAQRRGRIARAEARRRCRDAARHADRRDQRRTERYIRGGGSTTWVKDLCSVKVVTAVDVGEVTGQARMRAYLPSSSASFFFWMSSMSATC